MNNVNDPLARRRAALLLHPTSLPGGVGNGDLGPEAYRFVDFLAAAGITAWQTLPLGPTHEDGSPYQALSVHAGSPRLISLDLLAQQGYLEPAGSIQLDPLAYRLRRLAEARKTFHARASDEEQGAYEAFCREQAHWLEDYVFYQGIRESQGQQPWWLWPQPLRDREPGALEEAKERLADRVDQYCFEQFCFFRQWHALKAYANERGILLFGDMPIFVAHDSAEVWAKRHYFALQPDGQPRVIAGVPPDYFSETGQRWGNPHYDWAAMSENGFAWWVERMRTQLELFDWVRVDHFRGFEAYWEIPADAATAIDGHWVKAPGDALFGRLREVFGTLPLVAEDLGLITPEVDALRRRWHLPGMKVLQFAFEGGPDNPYLPHNHEQDGVVYTGTHDNNTSLGWFQGLSPELQRHVVEYLGHPSEPMPWPLIRTALASVAAVTVLPMQDALALGGEHRMNKPGTTEGNWTWRFTWAQVPLDLAQRLQRMIGLYGRAPD